MSHPLPTTSELAGLWSFLTPRERAEIEALLRGRPPALLLPWLRRVTPSWRWDWPHLLHVEGCLDRVTRGELSRLMLFLPPRHGKSELATIRYPVFRLEREPALRVIVGAYNQTLASKFSRKARRIAQGRIVLAKDRSAVEDWETTAGGGFRAVGVGAGITGQGGDLIVIDDPVKSREEAESEAYRERVWEWYTDDLYTRCEPGGAIILIQTRWHEDDLAGRILASEDAGRWETVSLPALAEADDPLGRAPGEALCPERFDVAALEAIRTVLGRSFHALYQQSPRPRGGRMFPREKVALIAAAPAVAVRVRYWDKAGTAGGGDFSAGVLMSRIAPGLFTVEDVIRGQWSAHGREAVIRQTVQMDRQRWGPGVVTWVEEDPGAAGKESAENTVRNLAGYRVRSERVTGEKVVRAAPLSDQWEAGNVRLLEGAWNRAYLDEMEAFPAGKFDDQVDASSGAFAKLAVGVRVPAATTRAR
jgi:predicted phage terminase large subunit-like protein